LAKETMDDGVQTRWTAKEDLPFSLEKRRVSIVGERGIESDNGE
jgi:hypothetical protein